MRSKNLCQRCRRPLVCSCCGMYPHEDFCDLRNSQCQSCAEEIAENEEFAPIDEPEHEPGVADLDEKAIDDLLAAYGGDPHPSHAGLLETVPEEPRHTAA